MYTRTTTPTALAGAATPAGTERLRARLADRYAADFYRPFAGNCVVSSIGLGTYLGECDEEEDARYRDVARLALERGVNLVDTAINYRCQRSERSVGEALREAVAAGTVRRDEVVVCTKGGYIPLDGAPPPTREGYQEYVRRTFVDAGLLAPDDIVAGGHAIAPAFLAHQIARSRANLGVETIDVYYLHNPEQQLDALSPERFRERMAAAFAMLEERVRARDIAAYGCATWTGFRVPAGERGHLSLQELVGIAREVGGDDHHFRAVQLPVNLAMNEAVRTPTQQLGRGAERARVPLLEAAAELGICVVASASLMQAQLTRALPPQLREVFPGLTTDAQRALAFVRSLPGVTAALVGMRSPAHLDENLGAAR